MRKTFSRKRFPLPMTYRQVPKFRRGHNNTHTHTHILRGLPPKRAKGSSVEENWTKNAAKNGFGILLGKMSFAHFSRNLKPKFKKRLLGGKIFPLLRKKWNNFPPHETIFCPDIFWSARNANSFRKASSPFFLKSRFLPRLVLIPKISRYH